jgi:DNA-binding NarL/FixJ family response regulator
MNILLADDNIEVRSALQLLVGQQPGLKVVGEVAEISALLSTVWDTRPHLIVLDWELPGRVDAALIAWLHALIPRPCVLALSSYPEVEKESLAAGADAFVSKGASAEQLLKVLSEINTCNLDEEHDTNLFVTK